MTGWSGNRSASASLINLVRDSMLPWRIQSFALPPTERPAKVALLFMLICVLSHLVVKFTSLWNARPCKSWNTTRSSPGWRPFVISPPPPTWPGRSNPPPTLTRPAPARRNDGSAPLADHPRYERGRLARHPSVCRPGGARRRPRRARAAGSEVHADRLPRDPQIPARQECGHWPGERKEKSPMRRSLAFPCLAHIAASLPEIARHRGCHYPRAVRARGGAGLGLSQAWEISAGSCVSCTTA